MISRKLAVVTALSSLAACGGPKAVAVPPADESKRFIVVQAPPYSTPPPAPPQVVPVPAPQQLPPQPACPPAPPCVNVSR